MGVYGIMNDHQLAIGESTFEGRKELQNKEGLIDCDTLTRLMLERAKTAREAIRIAGQLIEQYGYYDEGEALTIADTREVWLLEIVGPGKGAGRRRLGRPARARRSRLDRGQRLADRPDQFQRSADFFMASKNVLKRAEKLGLLESQERPALQFPRRL